MTPTEHEGTVAVDAAARAYWTRNQDLYDERDRVAWDDLAVTQQLNLREAVLPLVWAALEALPDRRAAALLEARAAVSSAVSPGFGMNPDGSEDPTAAAYVEGLHDAWSIIGGLS